MDFKDFYMFGNRNECPLQMNCLLVYFICDLNMTPFEFSVGHVAQLNWYDAPLLVS